MNNSRSSSLFFCFYSQPLVLSPHNPKRCTYLPASPLLPFSKPAQRRREPKRSPCKTPKKSRFKIIPGYKPLAISPWRHKLA